jgi:hypothetical protein
MSPAISAPAVKHQSKDFEIEFSLLTFQVVYGKVEEVNKKVNELYRNSDFTDS